MKIGTVLVLNLLFVAGGIFVYDALVRGDGRCSEPAPVQEAPQEIAREEPVAAPQPVLQGAGMETLARRIAALEATLAARPAPATVAGVVPDSRGDRESPALTGTGGTDGASSGTIGGEVLAPSPSAFEPQRLADFRAMLDVVEKQRQEERRIEAVKNQLQRLEVQLTPDQERAVIAEISKFREKLADTFRGPNRDGDRTERESQYQQLVQEHEQALLRIAPANEVQKIVAGMGRIGGMRQTGRADRLIEGRTEGRNR
jgi:hypothetical protein